MRPRFISLIVLLASVGARADAQATAFVFASPEEGRAVLMQRDEFVSQMSPFDRAARLKTPAPVSVADYLKFVGRNVVPWDARNKALVQTALDGLKPKLARLAVPLPEKVLLVQSTGLEEGQAEYTRGDAIVFPAGFSNAGDKNLEFVLAHELFHIVSRRNPELRDELYEAIGFERCAGVAFPSSLASRKITNPDAPFNQHCIDVKWSGDTFRAMPVLYADAPAYDVKRGGEFFEYLQFRLMLDTSEGSPSPAGSLRLVKFDQVTGFFEQVGSNTTYIIHPEEILADNFAQIITGANPVATPEIHARVSELMLRDD